MIFFPKPVSCHSIRPLVEPSCRLIHAIRKCTIQSPVQPGQHAEMERSFTQHDVAQYAVLIQDPNPLHASVIDRHRHPLYRRNARQSSDGGTIVHGMLVASLFGSIVGTIIPQAVYLTQNITFQRPVFTNDLLIARIEVLAIQGGQMTCQTAVNDRQTNQLVVDGQASVWIPREFR